MPLANDIQLGLANRFIVSVIPSGYDLGSWAKAEGLDVSWEVPEYRAGDGWNLRWYYPGLTKYTNVKLSRAATAQDTPKVKEWLNKTSMEFEPGDVKIELRDSHNQAVTEWILRNAMPVKWSIAGFDATASKVAIETLELTHLGFLEDELQG